MIQKNQSRFKERENPNKKMHILEHKNKTAFLFEIFGESAVLISSSIIGVILTLNITQVSVMESYTLIGLLFFMFAMFIIGVMAKIASRKIEKSSLNEYRKMMDKGREGGIY